MYRGFKLDYSITNENYYSKGNSLFSEHQSKTRKALDKYINKDGLIDGDMMEADWFPQIEADIFISHSHGNRKNAITLAGWLNEEFGLIAFIDSCVWGYADSLLYKIDQEYSLTADKTQYDSRKRNFSTSHVHMMLSSALGKMMDRCECLFFLNTPDFITAEEVIKDETESPWIYAEIAMSRIIRRTIPERREFINETKLFSKGGLVDESLRIKYHMNLDHLVKITQATLDNWKRIWPGSDSSNALDDLYDLKALKLDNLLKG